MSAGALRRNLWAEAHAPWFARMRAAKPVLPLTRVDGTAVYGAGSGGPALVHLSPVPGLSGGPASILAAAIGGTAVVAGPDAPLPSLLRVAESAGADPARVALVGEGTGAAAALTAAVGARSGSDGEAIRRLVLLHPDAVPALALTGLPAVFLQAERGGARLAVVRGLELDLREAGVAVREVEYPLPDGWTRYPRAVRGARDALEDVIGFLKRGFGTEGTFGIIPAWDLS